MENGSGGFMGDLVFNGGNYGIWIGNQQYVHLTTENLMISDIFSDSPFVISLLTTLRLPSMDCGTGVCLTLQNDVSRSDISLQDGLSRASPSTTVKLASTWQLEGQHNRTNRLEPKLSLMLSSPTPPSLSALPPQVPDRSRALLC